MCRLIENMHAIREEAEFQKNSIQIPIFRNWTHSIRIVETTTHWQNFKAIPKKIGFGLVLEKLFWRRNGRSKKLQRMHWVMQRLCWFGNFGKFSSKCKKRIFFYKNVNVFKNIYSLNCTKFFIRMPEKNCLLNNFM